VRVQRGGRKSGCKDCGGSWEGAPVAVINGACRKIVIVIVDHNNPALHPDTCQQHRGDPRSKQLIILLLNGPQTRHAAAQCKQRVPPIQAPSTTR